MNINIKKILLVLFIITAAIIKINVPSSAYEATERVYGSDRYSTAVEISKNGWKDGADNVILATGEDFPDALCAAPLAKQLNAPILLTGKDKLDVKVNEEIKRLGAKNIIIIGGTGVISQSVETSLKDNGLNVKRLFGLNRYETSLAVAGYSDANFINEVVVATGEDFPDALSIASIAAKLGMPIILSPKDVLMDGVKEYIRDKEIEKSYVIGGIGVIGDEVLKALGNAERISGMNRYETNKAVIQRFAADVKMEIVFLATGEDFPDALSGSALAPNTLSPIVLASRGSISTARDIVAGNEKNIKKIVVLGGEGVMPASDVDEIVPEITKEPQLPPAPEEPKDTEPQLPPPPTDVTIDQENPIMGKSEVSAEKMAAFLIYYNPEPKINTTALELAQMFIEEGEKEGVRGDIAFCQSIHETGWFRYGGLVLPLQNNYSGLGATNNSPVGKGAWFDEPRIGVRAQIQHLKGYATKDPLNEECVDPRYSILVAERRLGVAPNWEDLNGKWAVPGTNYGQTIMDLYERMKAFE
ncbi:N-acetylmuramoyl-L-alanine amidase LytC precursor [Oxobacter pfennigii]|uniref:N-acetylmuramoyl-L-alanine amidase LytC n=1 Tax=Oxobacter pfennigii TaxID=36849 RepID=A0A0P8X061_9CLOT|nr:cell wall-binding repeat-containing protein [Oxobacter pfennigii]KPU44137.1 N-acetylmuramoyl-L-alanine amidase LytC precursor [Oxobacter pfennigii]